MFEEKEYILRANEEIKVGDIVTLVNPNCEFDFDNKEGIFCETTEEYTCELEIINVDTSEYVAEKSNNGGCYAYATAKVLKVETVWIEFEVWCDEVSISGYMALDEADDEAPLQFYDADGFECGNHIRNTQPIKQAKNETEKWILVNWEAILNFMRCTDVVQYLVDNAFEEKCIKFGADVEGVPFVVELYINCSKLDQMVEDKSTTIRIKQSTKDMLDVIGCKNSTYDDIIRDLINLHQ